MTIGVLALQGAFSEHIEKLRDLGINAVELRCKSNINDALDGLILPGGESTVQIKLLRELNMFDSLKNLIISGIPTFGTCAGLILLASAIDGQSSSSLGFSTMPVTVKRNAYGRQLGSFHTTAEFEGIGNIPMTFIRAPIITQVSSEVEILAKVDNKIVGVHYKNQYGLSFHPELEKLEDVAKIYTYVGMYTP